MAGDIGMAEAGLRLAEQKAPTPASLNNMIYQEASKAMADGNSKAAAEKLKNPGKLLSEAEAKKRIDLILKDDDIDATGNPKKTAEQQARKDKMVKVSSAVIHLREKGYTGITPAEQSLLRDTLYQTLYDHPAIREIAKSKGVTLTAATYNAMCKNIAESILKNGQMSEALANGLVDVLVKTDIDYKTLLADLDSKKDLDKTIKDLETEIGYDGTGGTTLDGLHKEVSEQSEKSKRYKTKIVPGVGGASPTVQPEVPGGEAQLRIDAEARLGNVDKQVKLFENTVKQVDNAFNKNAATATFDVTDPDNPATTITITRTDWANKKTEWENKIKDFQTHKTADQRLIEKIDKQEKEEEDKLKQVEEKLKTKEDELTKKTKDRLDLEKKIKKSRDVNENGSVANQEQELVDSLNRVIINEGLELWSQGTSAAEASKPEVIKSLDEMIRSEVKKHIQENIYDESRKKFRNRELNTELDDLLKNGVDNYGISNLQSLWTRCNAAGAPPELQRLIPAIKDVVDFATVPPTIINAEKLRVLSTDAATDMLKVVAFKNPRWLEKKFTHDEVAMAKLKGDILPDLIMQAHKDKSLQAEIEKGFGEKLTKGNLIEKMARWDWSKLLWALGILAGIGVAIGATALIAK